MTFNKILEFDGEITTKEVFEELVQSIEVEYYELYEEVNCIAKYDVYLNGAVVRINVEM